MTLVMSLLKAQNCSPSSKQILVCKLRNGLTVIRSKWFQNIMVDFQLLQSNRKERECKDNRLQKVFDSSCLLNCQKSTFKKSPLLFNLLPVHLHSPFEDYLYIFDKATSIPRFNSFFISGKIYFPFYNESRFQPLREREQVTQHKFPEDSLTLQLFLRFYYFILYTFFPFFT